MKEKELLIMFFCKELVLVGVLMLLEISNLLWTTCYEKLFKNYKVRLQIN